MKNDEPVSPPGAFLCYMGGAIIAVASGAVIGSKVGLDDVSLLGKPISDARLIGATTGALVFAQMVAFRPRAAMAYDPRVLFQGHGESGCLFVIISVACLALLCWMLNRQLGLPGLIIAPLIPATSAILIVAFLTMSGRK